MVGKAHTTLRRVLGILVPLVLAGGAAWFYANAPSASSLHARAHAQAEAAAPVPVASARTTATPTPPGRPTSDSTSNQPTTGEAAGPGVTEPGIRLSATPTPLGALEVSERVRLPADVTTIEIAVPDLARAGPGFAMLRPAASAVQLTAGDQPVVLPDDKLSATETVPLTGPTRTYELRYVLEGATVRSVPSKAGRALAALAPLSRSADPSTPVVILTSGDRVRNLACPRLAGDALACSDGVVGRMAVRGELRLDDALVVLQLDLPRP
jgi:hypothetical protein